MFRSIKEALSVYDNPRFTGQSCSNILMAMVNYGLQHDDLCDDLKRKLYEAVFLKAASFNSQEIANTINALSKMGWDITQDLQDKLLAY